ncbi:hypothetical protein BDQ17DRAFT_1369200, partial [Cyathus striatus]
FKVHSPYPRNRLSKPPPANYTPRRHLSRLPLLPRPLSPHTHPRIMISIRRSRNGIPRALSDVQGTFTPMTTLPLRIRRGLSRRKERPTSSPIPVVVGSPAAAGYDLGTREGEGSEREFHSPRRSGENQGQDITDRAGATSPLSQSQTSTASGSAGRKGRRVSPPALPPDFSLQSQLQSQEGERRLSVVPEIPSVGSPTPDGMRTAPSTVAHSPSAALGFATGTGPRNRISNPTDPEMVQRRSAGVWGGKEKEKKKEKQPTLVLQNKVMAQAIDPNELSFKKGDILEILDSSGNVVPSNYVRLLS